MHQMRASGGLWFSYGGFRGVVDPGPGCLVHLCSAVPELNPTALDGVLLSHRHIDHCTDMNVLVEAMMEGGFVQRGTVALPEDALRGEEPVLLQYLASKVENLYTWRDGTRLSLGDRAEVEAVGLLHHGVQCYGMVFRGEGLHSWGIISDTRPFAALAERFSCCDILVLNVTLQRELPGLDHFAIPDVERLLQEMAPRVLLLTHLGRGILSRDPETLASSLGSGRTDVVAARDGLVVDLQAGTLHPGGSFAPAWGSHTERFLKETTVSISPEPSSKEVLPS